MRVAFVTPQFLDQRDKTQVLSGGAELHLYNLIRNAQRQGLQPRDTLVVQQSPEPFTVDEAGIGTVVGIPARAGMSFQRKARACVSRFGATTVHYNELYLAGGAGDGVPVTATFHGVGWDMPRPFPVDWTARPFVSGVGARLFPLVSRWQTLSRLSRVQGVLSVDRTLLLLARATLGRHADRVSVVPNALLPQVPERRGDGVDVGRLQQAKAHGCRLVLYPRNVSLARGVHLLPGIVQTIANQFGPDFRLVITGKSVTGNGAFYIEKLQSTLKNAGLDRYVIFLGGVPRWQMDDVYRLSDVVIVPTFFSEGTSLSAIEALHHGLPTVVTNVGGLPEVIWDGYSGLAVPPVDSEFGAAVVRLLTDSALCARLSANARRVADDCFSVARWEQQVSEFMTRHWR